MSPICHHRYATDMPVTDMSPFCSSLSEQGAMQMPQKSSGHVAQSLPDIPTSQEVFRYRSTIRISIETATCKFNPAIPLDARRAILLKDPGWRMPWPPPLTGAADRDDLILAFSRIVCALGLKAGIPGSTAEAVRSGLFEMFSSVPQAGYTKENTESYRRFAADASTRMMDQPRGGTAKTDPVSRCRG